MMESGPELTLKTYNVILNGYFKYGQIKEAWQFLLETRRKLLMNVVTYTAIVHGYRVSDQSLSSHVLPTREMHEDPTSTCSIASECYYVFRCFILGFSFVVPYKSNSTLHQFCSMKLQRKEKSRNSYRNLLLDFFGPGSRSCIFTIYNHRF